MFKEKNKTTSSIRTVSFSALKSAKRKKATLVLLVLK
jgi:hypothetical protein